MASSIFNVLTRRIGFRAATELVRGWGGRRVTIPSEKTDDHPMALALGPEAFGRLVDLYGGQPMDVPGERNALLKLRDDAILKAWLGGSSKRQLAEQFGLDRSMIFRILKKAEAERTDER